MGKGYFKNGRKFANRKFMAVKKNAAIAAVICFIGVAMLFQQCKHEPILRKHGNTPTDTTTPKPTPEDTTICFERDILPLFVNNCAKSGCHNAITHKKGLHLYNYNGITVNINDVMEKIYSGEMNSTTGSGMYGNLTTTQIKLIERWIKEGMKNNTTPCPSKCDTAIYTYSKAVSVIMSNNCISCHSSGSPSGGAAFDNYAGIKASIQKGVFWNRLNAIGGSIMPPSGKLENCKLTQINKWINAGYPNN